MTNPGYDYLEVEHHSEEWNCLVSHRGWITLKVETKDGKRMATLVKYKDE